MSSNSPEHSVDGCGDLRHLPTIKSRSTGQRRTTDQILRRFNPGGRWSAYWRLIHVMQAKSTLLRPTKRRADDDSVERIALACFRLAAKQRQWIQGPEYWTSREGDSAHQQWCEFVGHILHHYPTPEFLAPIWLQNESQPWERDLHLHLAKGFSIRRFHIPGIGRIGKSAARHFMTAPNDCGVPQAIRWAQVVAAGGEPKLARVVMSLVPVSARESWEPVWGSVIQFLIRNQPISLQEVREIIQFIIEQRFTPARVTLGNWMGEEPVCRELDLHGWTLRRMRRWMANWREQYQTPVQQLGQTGWPSMDYEPLEHCDGETIWRIVELRSEAELRVEGGIMRHCVGSYGWYCKNGRSSIWSLRRIDGKRMKRVATIEIRPSQHRIVCANGPKNREISEQTRKLIRDWAKRERLSM